jgi:hypothetical protein
LVAAVDRHPVKRRGRRRPKVLQQRNHGGEGDRDQQRHQPDRDPISATTFRGRAQSHLPEQFLQEVHASLPEFLTDDAGDIFAAVCVQRIRLRHDQQVPEWGVGR